MKRASIKDIDAVHAILKHPDIWDVVTDDGVCAKEDFDVSGPLKNPNFYFLFPDPNILFLFCPVNCITWDVHINALKGHRGEAAIQASQDALEYMFANTKCQKVIAYIAEIYVNVLRHAVRCGLGLEGTLINSFLKNGTLCNQYIVGITKTEFYAI